MNAIVVDKRPWKERAGRLSGRGNVFSRLAAIVARAELRLGLIVLVLAALSFGGPAAANAEDQPFKSIAQILVDDDGRPLSYPSSVFYDPVEEEIYLVNGGTGRVVVYGPDFFPVMSIGSGRGVQAPRGGEVLENGDIYLCQVRNVKSPRPRISILNGAFFIEREIFLDEIPEAADFVPRELAISREGLIYLAGSESRGVLVLDNEGNFLRHLRPRDRTTSPGAAEAGEQEPATEAANDGKAVEAEESMPAGADIPEEFKPRAGRQSEGNDQQDGLNPVRINYVTIDSSGRLYLLSAETSKVYVYGPDEGFLFSFGEKGGTPRFLSQPKALAIDEKRGFIYVADYMRHTILVYSMEGVYRFEFGGRGVGPGWFNFPESLAINKKGQLIVADLFNRRIQVLEVEYDEVSSKIKPQLQDPNATARPGASRATKDPDAGKQDSTPEPPVIQGKQPPAGRIKKPLPEEASAPADEQQSPPPAVEAVTSPRAEATTTTTPEVPKIRSEEPSGNPLEETLSKESAASSIRRQDSSPAVEAAPGSSEAIEQKPSAAAENREPVGLIEETSIKETIILDTQGSSPAANGSR